jgi:hypothetical protein
VFARLTLHDPRAFARTVSRPMPVPAPGMMANLTCSRPMVTCCEAAFDDLRGLSDPGAFSPKLAPAAKTAHCGQAVATAWLRTMPFGK